jgi:hypothetical protein
MTSPSRGVTLLGVHVSTTCSSTISPTKQLQVDSITDAHRNAGSSSQPISTWLATTMSDVNTA